VRPRHVVRPGDEGIQARIVAPCRARKDDWLQRFPRDGAQVRDGLANASFELVAITGVVPHPRFDHVDDRLDRVVDELSIRFVAEAGLPPAEQAGNYAIEKRPLSHVFHIPVTTSPSPAPRRATRDPRSFGR
jgi:hypothetical protein